MEPEARYTMVGAALIAAMVLIVVSVLWLSRRGNGNETALYAIYFSEQSVAGIQVDGPVTMRGIRVGSIVHLGINPAEIERVRVRIRLDAMTPVRADTQAVIQRNLLTGLAQIDLVGGKSDSLPIAASDGEEFPVIPEGKTGLQEIQANLPQLLNNANELIGRGQLFFTADNARTLSTILLRAETFSLKLNEQTEAVGRVLESVARTATRIDALAITLEHQAGRALSAFASAAESAAKQVGPLTREARRSAQRVAETADEYRSPGQLLFGPPKKALGPGEGQ